MNNIVIKSHFLTEDSIDVKVIRKGKLVSIPVVRKAYEAWAIQNNKVMWDYEPLTLDVYWDEFDELTIHRHLEEYITVKGLVGDPMKDTFTALQDICNTFKRPASTTILKRQTAL